jgi:hypothetical protein
MSNEIETPSRLKWLNFTLAIIAALMALFGYDAGMVKDTKVFVHSEYEVRIDSFETITEKPVIKYRDRIIKVEVPKPMIIEVPCPELVEVSADTTIEATVEVKSGKGISDYASMDITLQSEYKQGLGLIQRCIPGPILYSRTDTIEVSENTWLYYTGVAIGTAVATLITANQIK